MSSTYDEEFTLMVFQTHLLNITMVSTTVILIYDWLLTHDMEVHLVWSSRKNLTSILYLLGRYIKPLSNIMGIVWAFPISYQTCYVAEAATFLPGVVWAAFSAVRAYAFSGRSKWIAAVVFCLSVFPAFLDLYSDIVYNEPFNFPDPIGCRIQYKHLNFSLLNFFVIGEQWLRSLKARRWNALFSAPYVGRGGVIVADCIVIGFMLKATGLPLCPFRRLAPPSRRPLLDTIYRSGTLAFCVLLCLNVVSLLLSKLVTQPTVPASLLYQYFRDTITSIIISRLLLNILAAGESAEQSYDAPKDILTSAWTIDLDNGMRTAPSLVDRTRSEDDSDDWMPSEFGDA
ncbi:hypothetical protein C8Q78DRAFT_1083860 [Trametes maxima]|nr:hypothetical protein C8Q78DRAFT_1083860 [Trametes maxima]